MVSIEALTPEHFDLVANWLSRPETNQWLSADWRDHSISPSMIAIAVRNKRNRFFLVRCDGEASGLVALSEIEMADGFAMVWYFLGREELAGRGTMTFAVASLSRQCFEEMGLAVLYAWAMEDNLASQRVLEKSHFQFCGRIRGAAISAGRRVDRLYYDLTPRDLRRAD